MDPLERGIDALKRQRAELVEETGDCRSVLLVEDDPQEKRELKKVIARDTAAIEGFDYVLTFCENLKEEICLD